MAGQGRVSVCVLGWGLGDVFTVGNEPISGPPRGGCGGAS